MLPRKEGGVGEPNVSAALQQALVRTVATWAAGRSRLHMAVGQLLACGPARHYAGEQWYLDTVTTVLGSVPNWKATHWRRGVAEHLAVHATHRSATEAEGVSAFLRETAPSRRSGEWQKDWWARDYSRWLPELRALREV